MMRYAVLKIVKNAFPINATKVETNVTYQQLTQ